MAKGQPEHRGQVAGVHRRVEHQLKSRHRGECGVELDLIVPIGGEVLDHRPEAAKMPVAGEAPNCRRRDRLQEIRSADDAANQRIGRETKQPRRVGDVVLALDDNHAVDSGRRSDRTLPFTGARRSGGKLEVTMPPKSDVVLRLQP